MKNRTTRSAIASFVCWWLFIWIFERDPARHMIWATIAWIIDMGFSLALYYYFEEKKNA